MTKQIKSAGRKPRTDKVLNALRAWRQLMPLGLAFSVPQILRAENHADYRYEFYGEEGGRMQIQTHSVYFEQKLMDKVTANGEFIYDAISGATPIGTHDFAGKILTTEVEDTRYAGNVQLGLQLGNHNLKPGIAYSDESDYRSYSLSLSDSIEFNEKNTILQIGAGHNYDEVRHANRVDWSEKNTTDVMIGLSQILSPNTVGTVNFTYGYDEGFLNDPYRLAEYHPDIFPAGFNIGVQEKRPGYRNRQILYTSLMHYFDSLNASLEVNYRFHHDSYEVFSHTVGLTWSQKIGKHLVLEPMFRFYQQSAADFYAVTFEGPFTTDPAGVHSSDYRLSNFYSLDYGLQATVIINDHVHLVGGYHRYEMRGLDDTDAGMYPKANIFTIGLSIKW